MSEPMSDREFLDHLFSMEPPNWQPGTETLTEEEIAVYYAELDAIRYAQAIAAHHAHDCLIAGPGSRDTKETGQ